MRGRCWVDGNFLNGVRGLFVEVGGLLRQRDEFRNVLKAIECEHAHLFRKAEIRRDQRSTFGAGRFFFCQLGTEYRGTVLRAGFVVTLPLFSGGQIDERERNFFLLATALRTAVLHDGADDFIAENNLKAAVFKDEALALGLQGLGGVRDVEGMTGIRVLREESRWGRSQLQAAHNRTANVPANPRVMFQLYRWKG